MVFWTMHQLCWMILLFEFKDAIREGDGDKILRCWKVLLMHYRSANHTNYASEAFHFIAQVRVTASPRVAAQLLWSRVVNAKGKEGHNITVDMHMEHLNHTVKEYIYIAEVGANVSQNTIIQCGQSLDGIVTVLRSGKWHSLLFISAYAFLDTTLCNNYYTIHFRCWYTVE